MTSRTVRPRLSGPADERARTTKFVATNVSHCIDVRERADQAVSDSRG